MHKVDLSGSVPWGTESQKKHLFYVFGDRSRRNLQRAKVYQTRVHGADDGYLFIFTTTSKDLQLAVGAMSAACQYHMALLLEEEFERKHCNQLLVFEDEQDEKASTTMVTMTSEQVTSTQKITTFTLSPAH